jgi:DNA gyrase subunit B
MFISLFELELVMNPKNQQLPHSYSEAHIKYLDPRVHVRLRPGMYIGGTNKRALHNMLWEVIDDAIGEFENTTYNEITISLLPNRTVSVSDNGLGLPPGKRDSGESLIEWHMTEIIGHHIRTKDDIRLSGGLHAMGISTINALSSFCQIETKRDGFLWRQTYSEGLPTSPLEQIRPLETDESTGTSISFTPDFSIMQKNHFDFELIAKHCQELAYLLPQLRFTVQDKRKTKREISFHYPQGLVEWVKRQAEYEAVMIAPLSISYDCEFLDKRDNPYTVKVDLALQWLWSDKHLISSYVNTLAIPEGGKHVEGLKAAFEKQFPGLSWKTLEAGFIGIMHILHPDPQFESQTRIRLLNDDVAEAVEQAIEALFAVHPEAKEAIQAHFSQR